METLEWSALEYEERERSRDWFWALGIIVITGAITSIIYSNYFFAVLLILSGILLGFFATKKPDLVHCELNDTGIEIRTRVYPFREIKSFWIQTGRKSLLFIKVERVFMPIISIPIKDELVDKIYSVMVSQDINEEEMKEHPSEKIMESLGF